MELDVNQPDPNKEEEIRHTVDDKRLDGGSRRGRTVIPVTNKQITGEPHTFPAEKELNEVRRGYQHEHGEGKQGEIRKKPINRHALMAHIAKAVTIPAAKRTAPWLSW